MELTEDVEYPDGFCKDCGSLLTEDELDTVQIEGMMPEDYDLCKLCSSKREQYGEE